MYFATKRKRPHVGCAHRTLPRRFVARRVACRCGNTPTASRPCMAPASRVLGNDLVRPESGEPGIWSGWLRRWFTGRLLPLPVPEDRRPWCLHAARERGLVDELALPDRHPGPGGCRKMLFRCRKSMTFCRHGELRSPVCSRGSRHPAKLMSLSWH
jgi:hypothetical protein